MPALVLAAAADAAEAETAVAQHTSPSKSTSTSESSVTSTSSTAPGFDSDISGTRKSKTLSRTFSLDEVSHSHQRKLSGPPALPDRPILSSSLAEEHPMQPTPRKHKHKHRHAAGRSHEEPASLPSAHTDMLEQDQERLLHSTGGVPAAKPLPALPVKPAHVPPSHQPPLRPDRPQSQPANTSQTRLQKAIIQTLQTPLPPTPQTPLPPTPPPKSKPLQPPDRPQPQPQPQPQPRSLSPERSQPKPPDRPQPPPKSSIHTHTEQDNTQLEEPERLCATKKEDSGAPQSTSSYKLPCSGHLDYQRPMSKSQPELPNFRRQPPTPTTNSSSSNSPSNSNQPKPLPPKPQPPSPPLPRQTQSAAKLNASEAQKVQRASVTLAQSCQNVTKFRGMFEDSNPSGKATW